MKAIWYEKQGAAKDVLQFGEMSAPVPAKGEVRVKIHASGVNPSDTKTRSGWGELPMQFSRVIPHNDGAGIIESVGEGVKTSRVGERVWLYETGFNRPFGTAAEYATIPTHQAIALPDNTDFTQGACLGVPAMTAHRAVFADGSVREQTLLVTGGAGAVGNYAIQMAKWGGAKVITTVSKPEQAQLAKAAGADEIINYKTENVTERVQAITEQERGVDRVVDVSFTANLPITSAVLKPNGTIASYASDNPEDRPELPFLSLQLINATLRLLLVYTMPEKAKLDAIADITTMLKTDHLRHNIAQEFSLSEVAAAHDAQDSYSLIGKAIIRVL